jgi:hypothetical protein
VKKRQAVKEKQVYKKLKRETETVNVGQIHKQRDRDINSKRETDSKRETWK